MAIAAKKGAKATKRRTTAAKKKVAGVAATKLKIAGVNFSKSSCHTSKGAAKSRAESVRNTGTRARVIKSGKAFCVYTGGKSKALRRKSA